jgi:hypothetical protein
MSKLQYIPWILSFMALLGLYLVTQKKRIGFLIFIVKEMILIGYTIKTAQYGFAVVEPIFVAVNVNGYLKWRREEKITTSNGGSSR